MLFHTNTYNKKPYIVRIWRCQDHYEHWHSDMEIYICLQGQFCIRVEGVDHILTAGDVLLVAGNESHEIFCNDPEAVTVIIAFGYALLGNNFAALQDASFRRPFFSLHDGSVSGELKAPLIKIRETALLQREDPVISDWEFRGSLYELAAYLRGNMEMTTSKERKLRAKHLENMYEVLQYIADHYAQQITLDQAAALAGYDKSYFSKQFSGATGMPFHRYLNRYRLAVACKHLEDRSVSVATVAELSGFTSSKMMSRLFRDTLGITPAQYRNLPPEEKNTIGFCDKIR